MTMKIGRSLAACGACCVLTVLAACQGVRRQPAGGPAAPTPTLADIPPAELRDVLAELANAHDQKVQLAFYISLPWKGVDVPFKDFYPKMSAQQGELAKELRAWAQDHHIDLTYHHGTDTMARAEKIMEDRQGRVIQSDNRTDLERDTLIQMYTDYEFRVSVLQALLPLVRDPGLKAYMVKSLKVHEEGSAQITELLKRFKP